MAAIVLRPFRDGHSRGKWSAPTVRLAASVGGDIASETVFLSNSKPQPGDCVEFALGRHPGPYELNGNAGPRWVDVVMRKSSPGAVSARLELFLDEPIKGVRVMKTQSIHAGHTWRLSRTQLGDDEQALIGDGDYRKLWIRLTVDEAGAGLEVSKIAFKAPDERRHWRSVATQPPLTTDRVSVLTGNGAEHENVKYDDGWKLDDSSDFEVASGGDWPEFWSNNEAP